MPPLLRKSSSCSFCLCFISSYSQHNSQSNPSSAQDPSMSSYLIQSQCSYDDPQSFIRLCLLHLAPQSSPSPTFLLGPIHQGIDCFSNVIYMLCTGIYELSGKFLLLIAMWIASFGSLLKYLLIEDLVTLFKFSPFPSCRFIPLNYFSKCGFLLIFLRKESTVFLKQLKDI
jgi:hypothetical protein